MKAKTLSIFASTILFLTLFASCTNDIQELETEQSQFMKQIVMTMEDFQPEAGSRTLYNIADGAVNCTWAANDTVGVFPDKGIQTAFPMTSEDGLKDAIFDGGGWALKDGHTYGAYYPSIGKYYLDKHAVPVSYEGQIQDGNGSMDHLGAYDYMVATPTAPKFGSAHFTFKHLSTLVQLRLTIPQPTTLTSVKLVAETDAFAVKGKVDIMADAPSITPVSSASELELALEGVSTTEENQVVILYMMLPPADLSEQTLKAVVITDESTQEIALEGKNFQAGMAYGLSGEIDYQNRVVTVSEAGTMIDLLGDDYLEINSLKLVGPINGDDVYYLRKMCGSNKGKLTTLDLSDASIVDGGRYYYYYEYTLYIQYYYYTSNNVLGDYMFNNCTNLKSIILPAGVTSIGDYAFRGCSSLISIDIPNSVTSIGSSAFSGCDVLTSINIPDNVTSIGSSAFSSCDALTSIDIPDNVTSIGSSAFSGCDALASIDIPDGVTSIGEDAFYGCDALISVTIGDGVTHIRNNTFYNCSSLTTVTIGKRVTSIGDYAFRGCSSLTDFYCHANTPPSITSTGNYLSFNYYDDKTTLHVPAGCGTKYQSSKWNNFFRNIKEIK